MASAGTVHCFDHASAATHDQLVKIEHTPERVSFAGGVNSTAASYESIEVALCNLMARSVVIIEGSGVVTYSQFGKAVGLSPAKGRQRLCIDKVAEPEGASVACWRCLCADG